MLLNIPDESAMLALGGKLARACGGSGAWIYLSGELGAGKTTLVRGFMRELGYSDRVKSPTYTLVESYDIGEHRIHHFDFYRINTAEDIMMMGLEEYFTEDALCVVEWPEHAQSALPMPDIVVSIQPLLGARVDQTQFADRTITLSAQSSRGAAIMEQIAHD